MTRPSGPRRRSKPAMTPRFEPLEARQLLSGDLPSISLIEADNRGRVQLTATRDLNAATVTSASVRVSTAGTDKLLGTADDVQVTLSQLSYNPTSRVISFTAPVSANTRYKVTLDASIIKDTNGTALDGEFRSATQVSGDGVAGGDLVFFTKQPSVQVARVSTFLGDIDIELLADRAPLTVANFLSYANDGSYDNGFFHRNASSAGSKFVLQGGGFRADNALSAIPTRAPVRNEFGVSNTRGTVAMAKLGNDPNSATNQFFFNLNNNASNLDNQNGGFTVFARVRTSQGLQVMDALSNLTVFNASSQNSAFNEIPVRDFDGVTNRGRVGPADLAIISRVALLVDVSDQAGAQVPSAGALVFSNAGVTVTIADLTGAGFGGGSNIVGVRFGSAGVVSSISFTNDFTGTAAVIVTGASRIDSITDSRRTTTGAIGFIASDTGTIRSVNLRGSIAGFNANGLVAAAGFALPDDIDSDGSVTDATAIFSGGTGDTASISINGSLNGSVVTGGALRSVQVRGVTTNADFRTGGSAAPGAVYRLGIVNDSSINTKQAIGQLSATHWVNPSGGGKSIVAPSIARITVTGSRADNLDGHFEPGLTLAGPGPGASGLVLGEVSIAGGVFGSTWAITGNAGNIRIGTDAQNWRLTVSNDANTINVGRAVSSNVTVNGAVKAFTFNDWTGGAITAGQIDTLRGQRRASLGASGDLRGNLTINRTTGTVLRTMRLDGGLNGAQLDIKGPAKSVTIAGDSSGSVMTFRATAESISTGVLNSTNINANTGVVRIDVKRWEGGVISGGTFNRVSVAGDARFNINNVNVVLNVIIGGDWTTNSTIRGGFVYRVAGDLKDSRLSLTETNVLQSLTSFTVGGVMSNSEFRAVRNIPTVTVGAMINSGIYVGAPANQQGLPPNAANTNDSVRINTLTIAGRGSGDSFVNSFVVTGRLGNATIARPQQENNGVLHGVAANRISSITLKLRNRQVTLVNPRTTVATLGDFRVQLNPAAPSA